MAKFTYEPIVKERDKIRLLSILDESGDHSLTGHGKTTTASHERIRCKLWHSALRELTLTDNSGDLRIDWHDNNERSNPTTDPSPQRYVALSYVWGDTRRTTLIEVNGVLVRVTENLEAALQALRRKRLLSQGYAVWVDALCINQDDLRERSEEVCRMRKIYKSASSIVSWLGEDKNGDGEQSFRMVNAISSAMRLQRADDMINSIKKGNAPFSKSCWAALARLMNSPYWSRVWILQEVAMGDRNTALLCGQHASNWGSLCDVVVTFNLRYPSFVSSSYCKDAQGPAPGFAGLLVNQLDLQQKAQAGAEEAPLLPILDVARRCLVTDDRDRVYGMLGMMPVKIANLVTPDYSQDVATVYARFARSFIAARGDLLLLEECTWPPLLGQPSWVPDWSKDYHVRLPAYKASGDEFPDVNFSDDGQSLLCKGVHIGVIDGLSATCHEDNRTVSLEDGTIPARHCGVAYCNKDQLQRALWQTLVGNRVSSGQSAPESYSCLMDCALAEPGHEIWDPDRFPRARFDRLMNLIRCFAVGGTRLEDLFDAAADPSKPDPEGAQDAFERIRRFWRGRRLLVTEHGRLGAGPPALRPGDELFVVLGSQVPLALRPLGQHRFQLVGCCYVHGYSDGEAVMDIKSGRRKLQCIAIR